MGAYNYARMTSTLFAGKGPVKVDPPGTLPDGSRVLSVELDACELKLFLSQEQWVSLANQIGQHLRTEEMDAAMTEADKDADKWPEKRTDALDGDRYVLRGGGPTGQEHGDLCVCSGCRLSRSELAGE